VRFGNEQIEADMAGVLEQLRRAVVVGHEP
jgi:hypothetical protein